MSASNLCEQERQIKTQKHRGLIFGRRPHEEEEKKRKRKRKPRPALYFPESVFSLQNPEMQKFL